MTLVDIDPNQPETHRKSNPKPVKHLPQLRVKETSEPLYDKLIVMDKLYPSQEAYVVPRIILWAKRSPSRATGEEYASPGETLEKSKGFYTPNNTRTKGMDALIYRDEVLTPVIVPLMHKHFPNGVFRQDNACTHTAKLTMDFLIDFLIQLDQHT